MRIKGITDEDFINYRVPSMFISTATCDFKCDTENGNQICQNCSLAKQPNITVPNNRIVDRYIGNPITKAIVFGGLEPMDQLDELISIISLFRGQTQDDIVIYTGYTEEELTDVIPAIVPFGNIIIKYGRFVPDQKQHYDDVLGVKLASDNQYAKRYMKRFRNNE